MADEQFGGILTKKDREYLRGQVDLNPEQERNRRKYIRDRVRNAITDFHLIFQALSPKDRKLIFRDATADSTYESDWTNVVSGSGTEGEAVIHGMWQAIAFFYTGANESGIPFEPLLENAVRAGEDRGPFGVKNVYFNVEYTSVEDIDIDGVLEKIAADEPLNSNEHRAILRLLLEDPDRFIQSLYPDIEYSSLDELPEKLTVDMDNPTKAGYSLFLVLFNIPFSGDMPEWVPEFLMQEVQTEAAQGGLGELED